MLQAIYPNNETNKEVIISSSIAGLLVYVLLIIYQPFGTSQFEHTHKYLLLFPYAIISGFSFCMVSLLMRKKRKWTISSELLKTLLILFLISILSYLYNALSLSKVALSFENYLYMFLYTSAMVFPIAAVYLSTRYIYLNNKINTSANAISHSDELDRQFGNFPETTINSKHLLIFSDYSNQSIEIVEEDFVYAEAANNYCVLYFYKYGALQKEMIRISLAKLLRQVQTDTIRKVHRSFIVNLKRVSSFKGNASGYKISIDQIENELAISRSYIDTVVPMLEKLAARP